MTTRATVLVPTHVHGPTLYHSVGSALAQTVSEIEIFIVGDGVGDDTRAVVADLQGRDRRIRFFDLPKGPRNGEIHRATALAEASGRIVCYLSDDDLWFPDHVATMEALLEGAVGFANALPLRIDPDGGLGHWSVDLGLAHYREQILAGRNWIPLTCGAHTLDAYRALPAGWTTTPADLPGTDIYMWQKLLRSGLEAASSSRPTVLVLPSPDRAGWTPEQRAEELGRWAARVADASWRSAFAETVLDHFVREQARARSLTARARILRVGARARVQGPALSVLRRVRRAGRAVIARRGR